MKLEQDFPQAGKGGELPSNSDADDRSTSTPTQENLESADSHTASTPKVHQSGDTRNPETQNSNDANENGGKAVAQKTKDPQERSASSADYVTPPDGGWGWLVVLSSFMIHVIADGIVYSFGVFLTELVDYFNAGRGEITWVGSLQPAITFTVGE